MEKNELKQLELAVHMARLSVKRAELKLENADDDNRKARTATLKRMKTMLEKAEADLKAAKPKSRVRAKYENAKESVSDQCKKIKIKKALSWTGLSIATVGTAIVAFLIYDNMNKDGEEGSQPDTV